MKKLVLLSAVFLLFCGCADLKSVNDFASASSQAAQQYTSLPVSFQKLCLAACTEAAIKNGKLNPVACDCHDASMADSVDNLFYNRISAYLDGLDRLSADNLTDYNVDTLTDKLTASSFGNQKLSTDEAGAYGKLGSILAKAVTDGYRRKKIELYIREANQPLSVLIKYLQFNLERNLTAVMKAQRTTVQGDYSDMLHNKDSSPYEKRKMIEDYYAFQSQLDAQAAQLKTYGKALQTIAEGHQKLYDNLGKFSLPTVKAMATGYAANIKDIIAQIKILKQ